VLFNTLLSTSYTVNMSDSGFQPLTRESMAKQAAEIAARQAQAAGIPVPEETAITPASVGVTPPAEIVLTPAPLEVAPPVIAPPIVVPIVKTQPVEETVRVVKEPIEELEPVKEPEPVQSLTEVEKELAEVELDEDGNPIFKVSSALTGELTGANLIVELPTDITAGGALVTDTGELVITGSIDVSSLITPTGEIDIIAMADSSDTDLDKDAQQNFIPGIPPIRISGVISKTQTQPGIPGGAHRGINPYWYVAMISGASLLIAGGIAISFYSGFFN
jgi:hypothetical protein